MADPVIKIKRSSVAGKIPSISNLELGELAINTYDGKVYIEQDQGGVGVGTTVIAINPWSVGVGSNTYNTYFTAGSVAIGTATPTSALTVVGVVSATSFYGDGSNLSNISSAIGISSNGVLIGTGITSLNFAGSPITSITESGGTATINIQSGESSGANGIEIVDDISSSFNGVTTSFTLSSSSVALSPLNSQQLFVNLGGVIQSPGNDYSVSGSNIIFSTAPQSGLTFSAVSIGVSVGLNVPADGSVTLEKIASGVLGVGIQSGGVTVGSGITTLNFIGAGNTFSISGNSVDISIPAGSSVANNTSTNATYYPLFTQQTSGILATSNVSTTKLSYNPSTGTLSATELNTTSDENLKENIRSIENPLEKIMQMNGVRFDWKETQTPSIGIIAQEIEKVLPELVNQSENHKTVNYNGLIGVLIEAIKEQQKQINELRNNNLNN